MNVRSDRFARASGSCVLILSPHLDDAVLSCWSSLEDAGSDARVATVFAGEPPDGLAMGSWDRWTRAGDYRARIRERRAEDSRALATVGATAVHLGFLEYPYRRQISTPALAPPDIAVALRTLVRERETILAPAGIDGNPDHLLVRDAARMLAPLERLAYFADLPYATSFGWPSWITGDAPDPYLDVDAFWSAFTDVPGDHALRVEVITLTPEQCRRKAAAMRDYQSQFSALEAQDQHRLTTPRFLQYEVRWRPDHPGVAPAVR